MLNDSIARYAVPSKTIDFAFYPRVPEITLELTNVCNLTCPYCANNVLTRPKGAIEWELVEKVVDECAGDDNLRINWLHGVGEPLLWKRLEEAVRLIRSRNAGLGSFATNGTLLYEDRVRALLDAGLSRIYVSIDTLDPDVYKATRGGNLAKVVENIQNMIRIVPPDFEIKIALMNHRDHRITPEVGERFAELFGRGRNVFLNGVVNGLIPGATEDYRIAETEMENCFAPRSYLLINKDGIAGLCCRDQDQLHRLGDVTQRSIRDIWYDLANQTTFRNIALGVDECPSVCTEKCELRKPRNRFTVLVPIGYTLPYEDGKALLADLLDRDELMKAAELAKALLIRHPFDKTVIQARELLDTLGIVVEEPEAAAPI
jgi:MoaA/NifB/PqqE/SkfB family radical SAM enzyme